MVLEQSGSGSAAVKSKVNVNQCNQEVRDGFSNERNPAKDCILDEGTKLGLCSRYDCCSGSPRIPSWAFVLVSWFSRCFLAPCASCSFVGVAPNLKIP